MELKGKVAIVTGASSGIGEATARLLATKGARVVLAARNAEKINMLAKELPEAVAIRTDMTVEADVRRLVKETIKQFQTVDILVNNAGQGYDSPIERLDIKTWKKIIDLDLVGPVLAMQEVIPVMRSKGGGAIVNISSGTSLMALPNMGGYSSLKRALVGISLTANEELKVDKITVSVVYPFITLTNFEKNTIKNEERKPWVPDRGDSPEYVAEKIMEAISTGKPEVFAHDWMGNGKMKV